MNWNEIGTGYFYPLEERKLSRRRTARFNTDIYVWSPLTGSPDLSATLEITVAICLAGNMYLNPLKAWICIRRGVVVGSSQLCYHGTMQISKILRLNLMLYYVKNNFCRQLLYINQFEAQIHCPMEEEITIERWSMRILIIKMIDCFNTG